MTYHLWDTAAGSYIGRYTDEALALATVKQLVGRYGPAFADDLSLGRVRDDGTILVPLSGEALIAQVRRSLEDEAPTTAEPRARA